MARSKAAEHDEPGLSRARIVEAAIALLDARGEAGLTFRALAARLATGAGAIYWHVANKTELLVAASDAIVAQALGEDRPGATPQQAIRQLAAGVFEAIDAHPWVGPQLSRSPSQTLQIFERLGRQVQALGGPRGAHFTAASTLMSYIIGVSVQNAAQGRALDPPVDRATYLAAEAARWTALDADAYPFVRSVAPQLRAHDDRAEFLGGIDLLLAGIAVSGSGRRSTSGSGRSSRPHRP